MNDTIKLIGEKIKGLHTTMFVTMDQNGNQKGRPMATQDIEFDGDIWFMTSKDSNKISEIKVNPNVGLMYGDASVKFVSISGAAELVDDKEKIKEYWNDFYKAWFSGPEDPNIQLIKVHAKRAEYWDHKGGKLGAYVDIAVSAVTGHMDETHEQHGVINF